MIAQLDTRECIATREERPCSRTALANLIGPDGVFVDGDWVESKDQDPNGEVRLIQLADVGDGVYRDRSARFLTSAKARELNCTFLERGDLLVARMPDPLGRACIFPGDEKPSVTVVDVCIVRTGTNGTNHRWLMHRINSTEIRNKIAELQSGSTRKRISRSNLARITFEVPPPIEEQQRIVAEIEKQFTRLDVGAASLKRVQTALKRYRASVLKAACEGRLVPPEAELARKENRSYETGEQLLKRILKERREKWNGKGKYREPAPLDTDNLPSIVPEGWTLASIDQLSSHITSGSRDWSQYYNKGRGIFILAQNVRPMRLDLTETQSVDPLESDPETLRTRVHHDDLLVTIVGARTGDTCRVPDELSEHYVCQSVALVRPVVSASTKFLELFLASPENGQAQWKKYIYGQGRPHLSFDQLKTTAIPLPPAREQERIVTEVERRLSLTDEIGCTVATNLEREARLRTAILEIHFRAQDHENKSRT